MDKHLDQLTLELKDSRVQLYLLMNSIGIPLEVINEIRMNIGCEQPINNIVDIMDYFRKIKGADIYHSIENREVARFFRVLVGFYYYGEIDEAHLCSIYYYIRHNTNTLKHLLVNFWRTKELSQSVRQKIVERISEYWLNGRYYLEDFMAQLVNFYYLPKCFKKFTQSTEPDSPHNSVWMEIKEKDNLKMETRRRNSYSDSIKSFTNIWKLKESHLRDDTMFSFNFKFCHREELNFLKQNFFYLKEIGHNNLYIELYGVDVNYIFNSILPGFKKFYSSSISGNIYQSVDTYINDFFLPKKLELKHLEMFLCTYYILRNRILNSNFTIKKKTVSAVFNAKSLNELFMHHYEFLAKAADKFETAKFEYAEDFGSYYDESYCGY